MEDFDRAVFEQSRDPGAFLPDSRYPPRMDGERSRSQAVARTLRQTIPGSSHQDRQVESNGARARTSRHPQGRRGAVAVLGPERPGSEGNLASNNENTSPTVGTNLPQEQSEKPTEKTPTRESAPPETVDKPTVEKPIAEKSHRPERASRSAAPAAPPEVKAVDAKPVEAKPVEAKTGRGQARRGTQTRCGTQI